MKARTITVVLCLATGILVWSQKGSTQEQTTTPGDSVARTVAPIESEALTVEGRCLCINNRSVCPRLEYECTVFEGSHSMEPEPTGVIVQEFPGRTHVVCEPVVGILNRGWCRSKGD